MRQQLSPSIAFDWIIFSSRHSVYAYFQYLQQAKLNTHQVAKQIAAVGPETAKIINSYGACVNVIPNDYSAIGMVQHFHEKNLISQRVFIPVGDRSSSRIADGLTELGHQCLSLTLYHNQLPEQQVIAALQQFQSEAVDCLIVTSPSAFINLVEVAKKQGTFCLLGNLVIIPIGETTKSACEKLGFTIAVLPKHSTLASLAECVLGYYT